MENGFTLIELLIALIVAVVAIGGVLQGYTHFSTLSDFNRQKSQALDHLESVMERIRATALNQVLINFPNGVSDGGPIPYETLVGGYVLGNEQLTVTYPNPAATPLEVVATITWTGPQGRPMQRSLSTLRAE